MAEFSLENCKPASHYTSLCLKDKVKIRFNEGDPQPLTVPQLFERTVKKYGDHPAMAFEDAKKNWLSYSYRDYWNESRKMARGFIKLGLQPRAPCGVLAYTRPEWFITQMATIFAGGVSAGIYLTNSAEVVCHILHSSEVTICVVDDSAQMEKIRSIKHLLPELKSVIQIDGPYRDFVDSEEGYYSWPMVEKIGAEEIDLDLELNRRLNEVAANECILLVYTSGTIGMPKGVMLSHDNIIRATDSLVSCQNNIEYGNEAIVSYLPMSHVGGQTMDFFTAIIMGGCVYFADRSALKGTLIKTLVKVQPTRFFGVPRIFEKIYEELVASEQKTPWLSGLVLNTARKLVLNYNLSEMEKGWMTSVRSWSYWLALKIVQNAKSALGLSRCKTLMIGAAPSAMELRKNLLSYDLKTVELYGLSETSGPMTGAWESKNLESCLRVMPGAEMKLVNTDKNGHGEICIRGRNVFMGYLNDPEKTNESISDDGWLYSGDIGYFDSKGNIHISGRLKELVITSGGENIPPVHVENLVLHELPGLSNATLVGDKRTFLTMLVTIKTDIDPESGRPCDTLQPEALKWIKSLELPYTTLAEILNGGPCPKVLQSIQQGIQRANANAISNAQRVQKFAILPHDFSIPTNELGPTLKIRRNVVLQKYQHIIENLYNGT